MNTTIIMANGDFPTHPKPLAQLTQANTIIACDGAAEPLIANDYIPHVIVGDLDSLPEALKRDYANILVHDPDQETNDLTKAINWAISHAIKNICILGATGKREDHTLGNLGLLADYNHSVNAIIMTDHGTFEIIKTEKTLDCRPGQQISIFQLTPKTRITTKGLRYPLTEKSLNAWWQGTLNESIGEQITISCSAGEVLLFKEYVD